MMNGQWDRDAELRNHAQRGLSGHNLIIARMWTYHHDLELQIDTYARAKTYYERTKATLITSLTVGKDGEKGMSVAAAEQHAEGDPDVWKAALAYRLAEQMTAADKEALKILHGELSGWQTTRADEREADKFQARQGV